MSRSGVFAFAHVLVPRRPGPDGAAAGLLESSFAQRPVPVTYLNRARLVGSALTVGTARQAGEPGAGGASAIANHGLGGGDASVLPALQVPYAVAQPAATDSRAPAGGNAAGILAQGAFTGFVPGFGTLEVTQAHLECMLDGQWLNDEVINFYLALLLHRELLVGGHRPRVHFHSTFFYNKLFADQSAYNFEQVRRWTTEKHLGYKLVECDLVVVPVHQGLAHWVLAVIDIKQREITYLDSLGGEDWNCLANLERYICDEARAQTSEAWAMESWSLLASKGIPLQRNDYDCGVFVLKYARCLADQVPLSTFSQCDTIRLRSSMREEIVHAQLTPDGERV